jgi:opacity protein-like surface antigen
LAFGQLFVLLLITCSSQQVSHELKIVGPMKYLLRVFSLALITLVTTSSARAQDGYFYYNDEYREPQILFELGLTGGIMNASTDIGGNRKVGSGPLASFTLYNTKLTGGAYFSATFHDKFAARLQFSVGQIQGADSLTANAKGGGAQQRATRNLNYRTSLQEVSLLFEIHPDVFWRDPELPPAKFSPYVLAGIGYLHFSPETRYGNSWVQTMPLRLEGQGFSEYPDREKYSGNAFSFPVGLGVRYELGPLFYARAEAAVHFTNTDYLDDASNGTYVDPALFYNYLSPAQANLATSLFYRGTESLPDHNTPIDGVRANSTSKDVFWTVNLNIGIVLNRKKN